MDSGMWAAIIGSLVLVVCGGVGSLFWSHMTAAQANATAARHKAHELEVAQLEQKAKHSEELRGLEKQLHDSQLEMARDYVRKSDHDNIVTEVFRKLETQDKQMANGFNGLRSWLDQKFDTITTQLHGKQDRQHNA